MIEKAENVRVGGERSERVERERDLTAAPVRSAPITEWTIADQAAWARAIAPRARLRKGGAGSDLAPSRSAILRAATAISSTICFATVSLTPRRERPRR